MGKGVIRISICCFNAPPDGPNATFGRGWGKGGIRSRWAKGGTKLVGAVTLALVGMWR